MQENNKRKRSDRMTLAGNVKPKMVLKLGRLGNGTVEKIEETGNGEQVKIQVSDSNAKRRSLVVGKNKKLETT